MTNTSPNQDAELRAAFEKLNQADPHACYCPRSTEDCTCAMKDEYINELMTLIANRTQTAVEEFAEKVKAAIPDYINHMAAIGEIIEEGEHPDLDNYDRGYNKAVQTMHRDLDQLLQERKAKS